MSRMHCGLALALALTWTGVPAAASGSEAVADRPATAAPAPNVSPLVNGPLSRYVTAPDEAYGWEIRDEGAIGSARYVELVLRSQTWRGVVWKHHLVVIVPEAIKSPCDNALLFIGGGSWRPENETPPAPNRRLPGEAVLLAAAAESLKTPVCVLSHVPHQPLFDGLREDAIISLTFQKFYETGDETWPLLLPMVKSAVRAMDAVQELCTEQWQLDIQHFTVTGASKRGWTTWLTSAVDQRVTALAPMVIDVLNMRAQMKHQVDSFGGYSEQIEDYTEKDLQSQMDTERGRLLNAIVDPFAYRGLIRQPKLVILGSNDRYWPLDACNLYWDQLVGDRYVLYCPNQGHGINDYARVVGSLSALHRHAQGAAELPRLDWSYQTGDEALVLNFASDEPVAQARVWTTSSDSRDFRESRWRASRAENGAPGEYRFTMPYPESGYAALFGEYEFRPEGEPPYFLSTNVRIVSPAGVVLPKSQLTARDEAARR